MAPTIAKPMEIVGKLVFEEYLEVVDTVYVGLHTIGRGSPTPYIPLIYDLVNIFPRADAFDHYADLLIEICNSQHIFIRSGTYQYLNFPILEVW